MAYREITVIEIKEVLRLWLQNKHGLRPIAEIVGVDRKTVRRYIEAAQAVGLVREGGEAQLTDGLLGEPAQADGRATARRSLEPADYGKQVRESASQLQPR